MAKAATTKKTEPAAAPAEPSQAEKRKKLPVAEAWRGTSLRAAKDGVVEQGLDARKIVIPKSGECAIRVATLRANLVIFTRQPDKQGTKPIEIKVGTDGPHVTIGPNVPGPYKRSFWTPNVAHEHRIESDVVFVITGNEGDELEVDIFTED